ncbi:hypothetical protein [Rummeliibacillus pycnus]|uniref:hypothetical protein n=1 Tax=Rummeliibacillus pycnus TaxID=101070 RepID=UPI0037C56EA4
MSEIAWGNVIISIIPIIFCIVPVLFVIWFLIKFLQVQQEKNEILKAIAGKLDKHE